MEGRIVFTLIQDHSFFENFQKIWWLNNSKSVDFINSNNYKRLPWIWPFFRFKPYTESEILRLRPWSWGQERKKVIRKAFKYNNKAQNFLDKDIFSVMKIYCSVYFWLFTLERCSVFYWARGRKKLKIYLVRGLV